ncbi:MAG: hypothetical protein H0W07_02810, partial [Chloroflexi bacterium]|nr:hypothetical protein [Chloroflexota bacterium]
MKDDTPIGDAAMAREATERPDEPAYGPAEASTASRTDGSIDRPANVPPTIWSTAADALEDEARPWSAAKGSEVEAPDTPAPEPASASVARAPSRRGAPAVVARSLDGRLARLHLRGSSITLARAELETMAGLGTLDREALADLAEARWRSGDLVGGGEAARAHLDAGGTEPLAMV